MNEINILILYNFLLLKIVFMDKKPKSTEMLTAKTIELKSIA